MVELVRLTIAEALDKLRSKEISATELTKAHLQQMESTRNLNNYITETPEIALTAAKASDERLGKGSGKALDGIPIAIKDLFCTKGIKTTAASKILGDFIPPYESTVSANLLDAGAVILGKLNLDEFAMGSTNLNSAFGPVINPWKRKQDDKDLVPGGSSGASAAAVAAHAAMGSTGTDTGGSIRQPAAFCGIVGIKPTYGRCSRFGIVAFASSLDQAGPMTRTVQDAAIMLEIMAGHDPKDATSFNKPVPNFEAALTGNIKGMRIGIPQEYQVDGMNSDVTKVWQQGAEWLKQAGAEIVDVSLPHSEYALPTYYILAPAEASSNLSRYDGVRYGYRKEGKDLAELYENSRAGGFGKEVKRRILVGTYVLSAGYYDAYYVKDQRVRRLITEDFTKAFEKVDLLLAPTTPTGAFPVDASPKDPIEVYKNDVLTVPSSLAGLPAASVPAGLTADGLPLGLQLIGPAFGEETVLRAAGVLETAAAFLNQVQTMRQAS